MDGARRAAALLPGARHPAPGCHRLPAGGSPAPSESRAATQVNSAHVGPRLLRRGRVGVCSLAPAGAARREAATALRSAHWHDWLWQGLPAYVAGAEFWVGEADAMADLPFHQDKDEALASRGIARCPRLGRRPRAALA